MSADHRYFAAKNEAVYEQQNENKEQKRILRTPESRNHVRYISRSQTAAENGLTNVDLDFPLVWVSWYSPVKAGSVPFFRVILNWSGVN